MASNLSNPTSYTWTIPSNITPSTTYRIRITGKNSAGKVIQDISDLPFTINSATVTPSPTPTSTYVPPPVYYSSPSATPIYSPSPSASVTSTPTPTYSPSPTPTPYYSPSSSPSPSGSPSAQVGQKRGFAAVFEAFWSLFK